MMAKETWVMEVKIAGEWVPVQATGSDEPYRFASWGDAGRSLGISYPDQCREARLTGDPIVRVREEASGKVMVPGYYDDGEKGWQEA